MTMLVPTTEKFTSATVIPPRRKIPGYLVREVIDGMPFYYKGYREVINKNKTLEELMSDSGLQWLIKEFLSDSLKATLGKKKYIIGHGEIGNHLSQGQNFSLDVAVFDKALLTPAKITNKFIDVPAKLVIEVDVNVELPDRDSDLFQEYVVRKVRSLFKFGTEKVVWVFTKSKMVISATPTQPWQFIDWHQEVELMEGVNVNIGKWIEEEGFNLAKEK